MQQLKIQIPFGGFYESVHDQSIDDAIESYFTYDQETGDDVPLSYEISDAIRCSDVDWRSIRMEYAQKFTDLFADEFELESLKFDDLESPREYNFATDRIFATIDADEFNAKIRVVVENHPDWPEYIRERFTDRDGFWSNYSNDSTDNDWTRDNLDECQYGVMVQFWIDQMHVDDPNNEHEWNDREYDIASQIELGSFESIDQAISTIESYQKGKKQ